MNDQLATWDEFRQMLAQAYASVDVEYDRIADNLMSGGTRKQVLYDLSTAMREARDNLDKLVNLAIRLSPPEGPARPLEAVLADIRALGHQVIRLSWHGGSWYLDTDTGSVQFDLARQGDQAYAREYREAIESALSWGEDPIALAEARLEQLKELREQQRTAVVALVETLTYRGDPLFNPVQAAFVHFKQGPCYAGGDRNVRFTDDIDAITCPACRAWVGVAPCVLCGAKLHRFGGTRAWVDSIGNTRSDTPTQHEHVPDFGPGPEEADSEHEAHIHVRWNVWSKDCDGEWAVTNSNLNEEQAFAAVRRLMQAALVHGPDGAAFSALPVGQVPEPAPIDEAAALVFLNPDPEVQPVADGPTDDEGLGWTVDGMRLAAEEQRRIDIASEERE